MDRYGKKNSLKGWTGRISDTLKSGGWGVGVALVAILCCAPVLIVFALYLAGSAVLIGLTQYKLYLALIALATVLLAGWRLLRPIGSCPAHERRVRLSKIALMIAVFGGYLAISYLLLPWLYALD